MICYALRSEESGYVFVTKTRQDISVNQTEYPVIIWDYEVAKDLKFYAHQHTGETYNIVKFELVEQA